LFSSSQTSAIKKPIPHQTPNPKPQTQPQPLTTHLLPPHARADASQRLPPPKPAPPAPPPAAGPHRARIADDAELHWGHVPAADGALKRVEPWVGLDGMGWDWVGSGWFESVFVCSCACGSEGLGLGARGEAAVAPKEVAELLAATLAQISSASPHPLPRRAHAKAQTPVSLVTPTHPPGVGGLGFHREITSP